MPTYEYFCENEKCTDIEKRVDITKLVSEIDREELCKKCHCVMKRGLANSSINLGKMGGGYNFHERDMGFGKREERTTITGEQTVAYGYKCTNKDCEQFEEYATVYKKMTQSDRKEKCSVCKKVMIRVFSCSYMWGRGSRPDSDKRKEQMEQALNNDDFTRLAELQTNFDSTGRSYFADKDKDKKKYKIIDNDLTLDYQYRCSNMKCKELNKVVIITKSSKLSGREEFCEKCNKQLMKIF